MSTIADDPRGLRIDWAKMPTRHLYFQLGPTAPVLRRRAAETLASRGAEAIEIMADQKAGSLQIRRDQVWVATRIDHASARAFVRNALHDEDETVRQAALNSIGLWRDHKALPALMEVLRSEHFPKVPPPGSFSVDVSLQNRRAAAEAVGRIGDSSAIP